VVYRYYALDDEQAELINLAERIGTKKTLEMLRLLAERQISPETLQSIIAEIIPRDFQTRLMNLEEKIKKIEATPSKTRKRREGPLDDRHMALWPPPGGREKFMDSLIKILGRIRDTKPRLDELVIWGKGEFGVEKWIENAIRITVLYTALAEKKDGVLVLTENGQRYLDTRDNKVVLNGLLENIWGVKEMLTWLKDQALDIEELHTKFKGIGAEWRRKHQVRYRLDWLRALGYVNKMGREYALTEEGKKIM